MRMASRILVAQILLSNLHSFTKVPKSGTLSQYQLLLHLVFSPLRKNVGVFICKIMNWPSRTYPAPCIFFILMTAKMASLISLVVSWGLLAITLSCNFTVFLLLRQIHVNHDDDDNHDSNYHLRLKTINFELSEVWVDFHKVCFCGSPVSLFLIRTFCSPCDFIAHRSLFSVHKKTILCKSKV